MIEKRNKKRIEELVGEVQKSRQNLTSTENKLWELIKPFVSAMNHSNYSGNDLGCLIEVRQLMAAQHNTYGGNLYNNDHMFRRVLDALEGKDTNVYATRGFLGDKTRKAVRETINMYDFHQTFVKEAEDKLVRYIAGYVSRRDGYRDEHMLDELIGILPDCRARFNLMESREYLRELKAREEAKR